MVDKFSTEEKVSLLLKKNLGKPSTDTAIAFFSEPSIDARPKVFPSQIFSSTIPPVRPTTGWADTTAGNVPDGLSAGDTSDHSGGVLRYYHKWPLEKITDGNHMAYKAQQDGSVDNPLAGSVPFNLDSAGGYAVQLYRNSSGSPGDQIFDGTGEWVVDPDAGTLTFYHYSDVQSFVSTTQPPFLSFFAYIGSTGLAAASPWTVVSDGIHYSDTGKTVLIGKTARADANTSYDLEVLGEAKFDNRVMAQELVCTSDRRLKKAIRRVANPLDKLLKLRGVRFRWRSSNEVSYGVVADEIEAQLPGSTAEGPGGLLSVNYNAAVALLIEAVKAQNKQIQALQKQLSEP